MASIKVLLFTSKVLSNGEHPVMLRVIKDRRSTYISIGRSCPKKFWDFESNTPKKNYPYRRELDILIANKLKEANKTILNFENEEKYFSGEQIINKLKRNLSKVTVLQFIDTEIERFTKSSRIGNANVYKDCKRVLIKFRSSKDFVFADITIKFLIDLESWLSQSGVSNNSISIYMGTLRALMNRAISEGYCPAEIYPFKTYNVSRLKTTTAKRAITKEQMKKIIELEIKDDCRLFHSKNYFVFSFYNMGMNFTDIAFLKWSDVRNERLYYARAKTGQNYNIGLLPPVIGMLNYYKENYYQPESNFIFPILNETHETPQSVNYRIEKVLKQTNNDLKEIAKLIGLDVSLTTYVARHSWATILKRSGVSTTIISEGLGHTTEKTTQIYLDSFENETLDVANKLLL